MPDADTRRLSLFVLTLGLAFATLALAGPAAAASKSCAKDVVADWYGDTRIDKVYPLHCYQEAIRSLPVDVLTYSNAKQDILRALAFARKGRDDPGPTGGKEPTSEQPDGQPTEQPNDPGGKPSTQTPTTPSDPGDPGTGSDASGQVDTSGPSSLPIPLLVLGGLALLLLAAGGVGYLSRRAQARRNGGPPGLA